jgi:hypothetical protein
VKVLEYMLQQGWFEHASASTIVTTIEMAIKTVSTASTIETVIGQLNDMMSQPSQSTVRQQLGPAFLAAAAAGDVEAGKLLLNYCPKLLVVTLLHLRSLHHERRTIKEVGLLQ